MRRMPWLHVRLPAVLVGLVPVTAIALAPIAPAVAQYRSLPPSMPLPAPMIIPRPAPEIEARPPIAGPEGKTRPTERVCIEKDMCVDVPVSKGAPSATPRGSNGSR